MTPAFNLHSTFCANQITNLLDCKIAAPLSSCRLRCQHERQRSIRSTVLAAAEGGAGDLPNGADDEPPQVGDWRAFRSQLLASTALEAGDASRESPENMSLLRVQNPYLAQEGLWAKSIGSDELAPGNIVLAMPDVDIVAEDARLAQLVILLLKHDATGSEGVILNRPSFASVEDLLGWGWGAGPAAGAMAQAFSTCVVYLGGMFPPNRIARQINTLLHGQADLSGCREVSAGIYSGGEQAAAGRVLDGSSSLLEYRFFAGRMEFKPGQLQAEIGAGLWMPAACSRSLVLKQCLQLPTPLWIETRTLMGLDRQGN